MKRIIKLYFCSLYNCIVFAFFLLLIVINFTFNLAGETSGESDLPEQYTFLISGLPGLMIFALTSSKGDVRSLLLAGVRRDDYVYYRYLHSLFFYSMATIAIVGNAKFILSEAYVVIATTFLCWLLKECLMLPLKIISNSSTMKGILIHICSGILFYAITILCLLNSLWELPKTALQIVALSLLVAVCVATPFSIKLAKKLYAKKDVTD